jgi:hypothetical protein
MRSSRTITLFAPPPRSRTGSSPFVFSIVAHLLVCACLILELRTTPRISSRSAIRRYTVRIMNVPMPEPVLEQSAGVQVPQPVQNAAAPTPSSGGSPAPAPSVAVQLAHLVPPTQILVQPDAPADLLLQHPVPVPMILRWSPPAIPVRTILPAPVQKSIIANLRPSIEPPNRELAPADLKMSSSNFATTLPALSPGTTSPIVVRAPVPAQHIPETASKQVDQPTPAQVMSFSNLHVQEGPVAIPLANAASRPAVSPSLGNGTSVNSTDAAGHGNPASRQAGDGPGQGPGASEEKAPAGTGTVAQNGAGSGPPQPSGPGSDSLDPLSVTRVHLAKDGQFGVVVVGSTLAEQYPETVGIWGGRLVYTVYLHLGQGKAWILQYALPPNAESAANNARPDAPWPFDIVQPHLDPADYTADSVMIHGFVNLAGRFERLAVVFPDQFAQTKFVLNALQQWQFRPARQNGQLAQVEVLLIIPYENE